MPRVIQVNAAVLLIALSTFMFSCGVRTGNVVLIPSGYKGWITIRYEVKDAMALPKEGIRTVLRVPSSGIVNTSNSRPNGYGVDTYYAVSPQGVRTRIPTETDSCSANQKCVRRFQFFTSPRIVTVFFVGTAEDISRFPKPTIRTDQ